MNEDLLRELTPQVLGVLVRRGIEFAAAEDAVQEALLEAVRRWPDAMPDDPRAWLITVAGRKMIDEHRSVSARNRRELQHHFEPDPGPTEQADDTLLLLSRCCHPDLTPASAVALTLRAVGGLTTAQIAQAFLVPEATMAQRISRAKRTIDGQPFARPGEVTAVLRVLYLIFNEGFTGEVDLAVEAIRLTRQLAAPTDPSTGSGQGAKAEMDGLLALMLLHHARRAARRTPGGELVPLADQDRSLWDTAMIGEAVAILQGALDRDALGEYQVQAAIAALHDDAARAEETDWVQILEWYDELVRLSPSPMVLLNRAVAVGAADGPMAGLKALEPLDPDLPRYDAVAAWLQEQAGNVTEAARLYVVAAGKAPTLPENNHLLKQAARLSRT